MFDVILGACVAGMPGAMGAAEEVLFGLDTVADHLAPAVLAHRGQAVDCTLEAVEDVPLAGGHGLPAPPAASKTCIPRTRGGRARGAHSGQVRWELPAVDSSG